MKLKTVKDIYRNLNAVNFGGVLEMPFVGFSRSRNTDGKYNAITMMFNLADVVGFDNVRELVYHEMVHQYMDEILNLHHTEDHGKEFKKQYNKFSFGIVVDKDYNYE